MREIDVRMQYGQLGWWCSRRANVHWRGCLWHVAPDEYWRAISWTLGDGLSGSLVEEPVYVAMWQGSCFEMDALRTRIVRRLLKPLRNKLDTSHRLSKTCSQHYFSPIPILGIFPFLGVILWLVSYLRPLIFSQRHQSTKNSPSVSLLCKQTGCRNQR